MKNRIDLSAASQRFEAVSVDEQMLVGGGLSWSGVWSAIKGAATWVKDNIFADFGNFVFGWKGTW